MKNRFKPRFKNLLLFNGFWFLLSCSQLHEQASEKMDLLNRKADSLDSLVDSEIARVQKLDSMVEKEFTKLKALDSLIHKSDIADSLLKKMK